ncbi:hypothetical protein SDC9_129956 [bioreactor metagenome]|uniref:Uncharacterized protein n=1 Tax=bioreactor metagenome TaxID=1076179 RepID=A0A645D0Z9_9ZZZZ
MGVAPAPLASLSDNKRLVVRHIGYNAAGVLIPNESPSRHPYRKALSVFPEALFRAAVLSVWRRIFPFIAKIQQGGKVVVDYKNDISSFAAVAAVGPACRNILLTVERNRSVPSGSRLYKYFRIINKHNISFEKKKCKKISESYDLRLFYHVFLLFDGVDRYSFFIPAESFEFNLTVNQREKSVIIAPSHIGAGMDLGSSLSYQYVAGQHKLSVRSLDTESFRFTIAAVFR